MKRIGGLYRAFLERQIWSEAFRRASLGRHDSAAVRGIADRFDAEIAAWIEHARNGIWVFGPYKSFRIRDPKPRLIHAAPLAQRVMHHAIVLATGKVFERGAIARSFACRRGKGQAAALRAARSATRRDPWYLKLDVRTYYDTLPHDALRLALQRRFRESRVLSVFDRLLDSYATQRGHGLPIGGSGWVPVDSPSSATARSTAVARGFRFWASLCTLRACGSTAAVGGGCAASLGCWSAGLVEATLTNGPCRSVPRPCSPGPLRETM